MALVNKQPSHWLALSAAVLLLFVFPSSGEIILQGDVPAGVNSSSLTSEYYRIYRSIAPEKRPVKSPLKIIYYSKSHPHGTGFALPEWGGGGAIGDSLIIIPVDFKPFLEQSFLQITVHEIVHIALARAYPGVPIPRWFHEGAAMLLSGELSWEENATVSKAIFFGRLMPLASIDSVNGFKRSRADLAYSQGHLAALFLVDQYGMAVLPELLRAARKSWNFQAGIFEATGLTSREFSEMVESYISSKYRFVFFITDSYIWWVLIAFLFVAGFIATTVRNRKRAAAMEEAERLEMERSQAETAQSGNDMDVAPQISSSNPPETATGKKAD
jgi:hypothetical protein